MLDMQTALRQRPAPRLQVGLARTDNEVMEAQRLRYRVFADELGARLQTRVPGVDQDCWRRPKIEPRMRVVPIQI